MQRHLDSHLLDDGLKLLATSTIDQGNNDFQFRMRLTQQLAGLQEYRRQQLYLCVATTRQHRQVTTRRIQPQALTGSLAIADHGHRIGHGVADKTTGSLMLVVEGFFKWQEGQHQIGRRLDLMNARLPPSPDRWADIMNRLDTVPFEEKLNPDIEIWGIDADEEIRGIGDQFPDQLATNRQQARQAMSVRT